MENDNTRFFWQEGVEVVAEQGRLPLYHVGCLSTEDTSVFQKIHILITLFIYMQPLG